ncbi:hypothetical protein C0J52_17955, partial [Blattella germanica]
KCTNLGVVLFHERSAEPASGIKALAICVSTLFAYRSASRSTPPLPNNGFQELNGNCIVLHNFLCSQLFVLAAVLAVANAGYLGAPAVGYAAAPVAAYAAAPVAVHAPAVGASHQSTVRTLDGNSAVSTYSKAVDTPFSSVRKYDTRISNDAVAFAHAPVAAAYAAPVAHAAYAAPVAHAAYAAPVAHAYAPAYHGAAYAAPAVAAPVGVAYSAAPAVAHLSFAGFGAHYAY